mgnify:CR=1 FL=1
MTHIVVIGCGVVGAAIAYELSQFPELQITLLDQQAPAQGSTGAALGVLMGAISQKAKGKAWKLRQDSLRRYETLIPELEALTGRSIGFNRQGILLLRFADDPIEKWESLVEIRQKQGWQLELWDCQQLHERCPQIHHDEIQGAVYSPEDRQLDPTALTLALVTGAQKRGVSVRWGVKVETLAGGEGDRPCTALRLATEILPVDGVVIAAGLGSTALTQTAPVPLDVRPVLGQAMRVKLPQILGNPDFQPAITGNDVHIVPLGNAEYWVGATVEFPDEAGAIAAQPDALETVRQGAIAFCPALAEAEILHTWSGLRPRPFDRPAPIIEPLTGYDNVWLATGHYRNGVLLAPATAQLIGEAIAQRFL